MSRPASTDPRTATAPAASTNPLTTTALAARTVVRRGIAARVTRIMPELYSPLIASTARMATTAWPNSMPVRLTLAGSWPQPAAGHVTAAAAAALRATVSAMTANSSQLVPASCVTPAQQEHGQAQGERGVAAQQGEAGPRRQRVVAQ